MLQNKLIKDPPDVQLLNRPCLLYNPLTDDYELIDLLPVKSEIKNSGKRKNKYLKGGCHGIPSVRA